ncbi:hypothetical protein [Nocardia sp. CA-290969]|uniref:hypothetical protein n=1 Tax=Nocardia sp. CA-290969 TaxID=3239986 RepID=UPI003D939E80
MKISEHLSDAVAFVVDVLTLSTLGIGSALAVFARLQPAVDLDDEDPVADGYDEGAAWDRAYDREIDQRNGVM